MRVVANVDYWICTFTLDDDCWKLLVKQNTFQLPAFLIIISSKQTTKEILVFMCKMRLYVVYKIDSCLCISFSTQTASTIGFCLVKNRDIFRFKIFSFHVSHSRKSFVRHKKRLQHHQQKATATIMKCY